MHIQRRWLFPLISLFCNRLHPTCQHALFTALKVINVTRLAILDLDQNKTGYSRIGSEQEGYSRTGAECNIEQRLVRRWFDDDWICPAKITACSNEIGSLTSLMHVTQVHPGTTENQFHCTRLHAVRSNNKRQVFSIFLLLHTITWKSVSLPGKQSRIYKSMAQEIANSNGPENLLWKTEALVKIQTVRIKKRSLDSWRNTQYRYNRTFVDFQTGKERW